MLPGFPCANLRNDALANVILFSNHPLRDTLLTQSQDCSDLCIGKFCIAVRLSYRHASLVIGILQILFLGSDKQVPRIAAWPIVAFVAHKFACWNRTVRQFVRKSMGSSAPSINESASSIAVFIGSLPRPALAKLTHVNLSPKPVQHRKVPRNRPPYFGTEFSHFDVRFPCSFWHGLTL